MARSGSQVSRRSVVARSCLRAWRGMGKPTLWTTSPTRQWMVVLVLVGSATSTVRAQCASAGLSHADCTACIATAGYYVGQQCEHCSGTGRCSSAWTATCSGGSWSASSSDCTTNFDIPCSSGEYRSSSSNACLSCQAGRYQSSSSHTESSCIDCLAGQYDRADRTGCDSCPIGETSFAGSDDSSDCREPLPTLTVASFFRRAWDCVFGSPTEDHEEFSVSPLQFVADLGDKDEAELKSDCMDIGQDIVDAISTEACNPCSVLPEPYRTKCNTVVTVMCIAFGPDACEDALQRFFSTDDLVDQICTELIQWVMPYVPELAGAASGVLQIRRDCLEAITGDCLEAITDMGEFTANLVVDIASRLGVQADRVLAFVLDGVSSLFGRRRLMENAVGGDSGSIVIQFTVLPEINANGTSVPMTPQDCADAFSTEIDLPTVGGRTVSTIAPSDVHTNVGTTIDCWGSWGPWGECSASCGGGTQARGYSHWLDASYGGRACLEEDGALQERGCNEEPCWTSSPPPPPPPPPATSVLTALLVVVLVVVIVLLKGYPLLVQTCRDDKSPEDSSQQAPPRQSEGAGNRPQARPDQSGYVVNPVVASASPSVQRFQPYGGWENVAQPTDEDKVLFQQLDTNCDGTLSKKEAYELIKRCEYAVSEAYIEGIYVTVDVDGNDQLDIEEFATLMKHVRAKDAANMSDV